MSLTIPNALTLFRIIAIPVIVAIYFTDIQYKSWICVILFSLAGISDALDGYCIMLIIIATNFELRSSLWSGYASLVTIIVIISREITVSALREWMAELGKRSNVAVSNVGKFKTGMQMGAIGCLLFGKSFIGLPVVLIGEILLYIAGVLTVWSMTIYLIAAYKAVNED